MGAAAVSVTWILAQDALVIGRQEIIVNIPLPEGLRISALRIPQWIFQWIGAFPYRAQAPRASSTRPCYLSSPFRWQSRFVIPRAIPSRCSLALVGSLAIPLAITVATLEEYGTSWQGRYVLPYLARPARLVWSSLAGRLREAGRRWFLLAAVLLLAVGHTASVVGVLGRERRESPQSGTDSWSLMPPPALLVLIVLAGVAISSLGLARSALRRGGWALDRGKPRVRLRWVGLGLLLLQLGWVVVIPPFAAMDEWDHAYRASAVAHGQWVAFESSPACRSTSISPRSSATASRR